MHIPRIYDDLKTHLRPNKALILFGPRRVGKTTLVERFLASTKLRARFDTGEDIRIADVLGSRDLDRLRAYAEGYDLIVIDEAQRVPHIGDGLKLLVDHIPGIRIIATGSSSFALLGQVGEPLTGRKTTLTLYPVAQRELRSQRNRFDLERDLERFLRFGSYPDVVVAKNDAERERILNELVGASLLKDILDLDRLDRPKALLDLLRLLAFQIGNEVSFAELGAQLGMDRKTVARYCMLLEETFVLYNLRGLSRNLRKEVTKQSKYYFYDLGVRNAIIANFNPMELRNDAGALFENFCIIERLKKDSYSGRSVNRYFWRTWDQQEIDLVEEHGGRLAGFEMKWGTTPATAPRAWQAAYPKASWTPVTRASYLTFVTGDTL